MFANEYVFMHAFVCGLHDVLLLISEHLVSLIVDKLLTDAQFFCTYATFLCLSMSVYLCLCVLGQMMVHT